MGMYELQEFTRGSPLMIIGEYHGNPGELSFYDESGKLLFSLRFTDWYSREIDSFWFPDVGPSLTGKGETADALESFFHFLRVDGDKIDQLPARSTLIAVGDEYIDFIGDRKSLFKLNIKGFKIHGL
jgi:U3 small nucleolar ribonucleoprotein protein IMP4